MSNDFTTKVLEKLNILTTTGRNYRRINHKLDNVITNYIATMKIKHNNLGNTYLNNLETDIQFIFTKIIEKQNYDALEYCNNIIDWYFNSLAYQYNLIKLQPTLPDYIIPEIRDIAKSLE
jgi:hypothetical protein